MPDEHDGPVVDRRRPAFCFQTHAALDAIREHFSGAKLTTALAVYLSLTEAANRSGGAAARDGFQAARAEMAANAGVSVDTLDRYAGELVRAGVLEVERRSVGKVNLPNVWTLPDTPGAPPGRTSAATPGRTGAANRARGTTEAKNNGKNDETDVSSETRASDMPAIVKVEGRNLPLDALAEACGIEEGEPAYAQVVVCLNGRKTKIGRHADLGIADLAWRELVRHADANGRPELPAELREDPAQWATGLATMIRQRADRYRDRFGDIEVTPKSLRDWWLRLGKARQGGRLTADDIARMSA